MTPAAIEGTRIAIPGPGRARHPVRAARRGLSGIEVLVSILLSFLLLHLALRALAGERLLFETVSERGAFLETVRVGRAVVGREALGGGSIAPPAGDSIPLRAFRGWGVVCPVPSSVPGEIVVTRIGLRGPDPAKDSVLVPVSAGVRAVRLLRAAGDAADCGAPGRGRVERWTVDPPVEAAIGIARYYERGSLHLAGGAIRYRRGRGGRQPLTPANLHTGISAIDAGAFGRISVVFGMAQTGDTAVAAIWHWSVGTGLPR